MAETIDPVEVTIGVTRLGKSGDRSPGLPPPRQTPYHWAKEAVAGWRSDTTPLTASTKDQKQKTKQKQKQKTKTATRNKSKKKKSKNKNKNKTKPTEATTTA